MKKHNLVPLLALVVVLAAGAAYGQLPGPGIVKANIPFNFSVEKMTFPAGEYILRNSGAENVLWLAADDSSQAKLIATHGVIARNASASTKLVFHRYGDQYFLSQIWVEGQDSGRELPTTRLEKELMSKAASDGVTILARK